MNAYLDFALPTKGIQRHDFIRRLLALSRRMSVELLTQSLERARKYRITSLETVERIALLYLQQGTGQLPLAEVDAAPHPAPGLPGRFTDRTARSIHLPRSIQP